MLISPFKIKQLNISSTWVYNVPTNTDCTICRCNLSTPSIFNQEKGIDSYVVSGDCLHSFHQECIKPWVDKNKSCPICSKHWNYSKKPTDEQILSSKNIKDNLDKNLDNIKKYNKYKFFMDSSGGKYFDANGNSIDTNGKSIDASGNSINIGNSIDISGNKNINYSGVYKTVIDSSGYKNIIAISDNKNITDNSGNVINVNIKHKYISDNDEINNKNNPKIIKIVKESIDNYGNQKKIKIVSELKEQKEENLINMNDDTKDVKYELKDVKYNIINMKDLWKEKKEEQLKYHYKMKYVDSDKKIDVLKRQI